MPAALQSYRAQQIAEEAERHFAENRAGLFIPGPRQAGNQGYEHESLEAAFPPGIEPGFRPLGDMVLVMLRVPVAKSTSGFIIDDELRKTERDNTQVGKVVAMGPLAFRNRTTREPWPEGAWCAVGDYVKVPKYQGDYTVIHYKRPDSEFNEATGKRREFMTDDTVVFAQFRDHALLGIYPTAVEALAAKGFI